MITTIKKKKHNFAYDKIKRGIYLLREMGYSEHSIHKIVEDIKKDVK